MSGPVLGGVDRTVARLSGLAHTVRAALAPIAADHAQTRLARLGFDGSARIRQSWQPAAERFGRTKAGRKELSAILTKGVRR